MEKIFIKRERAMLLCDMEGMEKTFNSFVKKFGIKKYKIGRNVFFKEKEIVSCQEKSDEPTSIIPFSVRKKAHSGTHKSGLKVIDYLGAQR